MSTRFKIQSNNTRVRIIKIDDIVYKISINKDIWQSNPSLISSHTTYWIRCKKQKKECSFKYGTVECIDTEDINQNICIQCNKKYKTRSGFLKHMKHHHTENEYNVIVDEKKTIDKPESLVEHKVTINTVIPDESTIEDETEIIDEKTVADEPIMTVEQQMTTGYIYCFETESMPGTYKIGMTTRDVDTRLKEANQSNTWKPPIPYQVVFSKYVHNPREKEGMIHTLLSEYRIHPDREFFKLELEKLRCLFGLITEIKE